MSTIKVNNIQGTGASTAAIAVNASDGTCTANVTNNLGNRNLIINGGMTVSQRSTSSSINASSTYNTLDRFAPSVDLPSGVSNLTMSQISDAPTGFSNSLKVTPNQARNAALSGADRFFLTTQLEAKSIRNSGWNYTDSNSKLTLSFYIKSNLTGVVSIEVVAGDSPSSTNHFHGSVTINSATTWERKTFTIIGNSNLVFNDDTGSGLTIGIHYAAGPTFTGGTFTPSTWQDNTSGNRSSSSNIDIYSSADNYVALTGVQLEVNDFATVFEHRSFGQELALCQRYFYKNTTSPLGLFICDAGAQSNSYGVYKFPVTMRSAPTVTIADNNGNTDNKVTQHGAAHNLSALATQIQIDGFCRVTRQGATFDTGSAKPIICGVTAADAEI